MTKDQETKGGIDGTPHHPISVTFQCAICENSSTETATLYNVRAMQDLLRDYVLSHHQRCGKATRATVEHVAQAPAVIDSACYCSDRMSGGVPCPPGKCPNVPKLPAVADGWLAQGLRDAVAESTSEQQARVAVNPSGFIPEPRGHVVLEAAKEDPVTGEKS